MSEQPHSDKPKARLWLAIVVGIAIGIAVGLAVSYALNQHQQYSRAGLELPDSRVTPGTVDSEITQDNIGATICRRGWTTTVRTDTSRIKEVLFQAVQDQTVDGRPVQLPDFELDHLIPLSLGGSPDDQRNLWLQPWFGEWNAGRKDGLERRLNTLVCTGEVPLSEAQQAIARDWISAYRKYGDKQE